MSFRTLKHYLHECENKNIKRKTAKEEAEGGGTVLVPILFISTLSLLSLSNF